jgi:hypothetical protein
LIHPADLTAWLHSYSAFVARYTYLAQLLHVEMFTIGSELSSLEGLTVYWQNLAAWVHRHYSGLRTYMAAGVAAFKITWWSSVDFIALSPYYSLSNASLQLMPSVSQLVYIWRHAYLPTLYNLSLKYHRPVLFAEIGYCSVKGTTWRPWNAYSNPYPASEQAQSDAYNALLQATQGQSWLRGIVWWHWDTPTAPLVDRGFSMRDKMAECVIGQYWSPASLGVPSPADRVRDVCVANYAPSAAGT